MAKRLALTVDGNITYCTATDENIGKGRCNHVTHQKDGQPMQDFLISIEKEIKLMALKSLNFKELKEIYDNKEDIDLLKKIENEFLLKYMISKGEKDFEYLAKHGNINTRCTLAANGLNLEEFKDDEKSVVREIVASKGYNLENYINDEDEDVRIRVV